MISTKAYGIVVWVSTPKKTLASPCWGPFIISREKTMCQTEVWGLYGLPGSPHWLEAVLAALFSGPSLSHRFPREQMFLWFFVLEHPPWLFSSDAGVIHSSTHLLTFSRLKRPKIDHQGFMYMFLKFSKFPNRIPARAHQSFFRPRPHDRFWLCRAKGLLDDQVRSPLLLPIAAAWLYTKQCNLWRAILVRFLGWYD